MKNLAIGAVSRKAGIPASTIRYYEQIGLLPPRTLVNGKRRYDELIFQKLSVIRMAQRAGFSIAEIQALIHDFPADAKPAERWGAFAGQKLAELEALEREIRAKKALLESTRDCACPSLESCADGAAELDALLCQTNHTPPLISAT